MSDEQQLCLWCFIWNYNNIILAPMVDSHINLFLKGQGYFVFTEDSQ